MDEYVVQYSPAALDDLKDIYSYILEELSAPQAAVNQVNRIRNAIRGLHVFPNRHELVDWEPWQSQGLRKMPVNRYIVFYFVDEIAFQVKVVRVVYGGRDLLRILDESGHENA